MTEKKIEENEEKKEESSEEKNFLKETTHRDIT